MKKLLISFVLILFALSSYGQSSNSYKDKLFTGFVSSYYLDFITSPLSNVDISRDLGGGIITPDTAAPYQNSYIGIFSIGLEPRYNIHELSENIALAVSMPVTMGFGEIRPQSDEVVGTRGYGAIQVPLLLKMYMGTNSTYNSTSDFGFSAGAGLEYNKIGIFQTESLPALRDANKGWVHPVFSMSIHFWRNNAPIEVNFKYGQGRLQEFDQDRYGQPLLDGTRYVRSNTTKLSLIYLFN